MSTRREAPLRVESGAGLASAQPQTGLRLKPEPSSAATRIVYVGHATVLVELDGLRLLTDPVLRSRIAHLRRVGEVAADLVPQVDVVLISHAHFDHLDVPTLGQLGRDVPIVVPRGAGGLLRKKGFGSVTELGSGDVHRVGELTLRATPAEHDPRRRPFGVRAEPIGYVIEGSRTIYFAGDTGLFDEMADVGPVDVALVPISGWGPRLGSGHLDAGAAAEAVRRVQASIAVPIHWGTLAPIRVARRGSPSAVDPAVDEFRAQMRAVAPDVEVRILRPGEATTL